MTSMLLQLITFSNFVFFISAFLPAVHRVAPIRCSSREAAELIQNRTANDDSGSLLVITCDASGRGGGSKHDGISAVLRVRHGVALLRQASTSSAEATTTVDNASQQSSISSGNDEKEDLMEITSRRTIPSRTSSEVAAIAFGVKHAIKTIPSSLRNNVLILSDSEFALDFYCAEKSYSNRHQTIRRRTSSSNKKRGKRQPTTRSTELREESYRRLFTTLLNETPGGVILSKIKSSSRSVGLNTSRSSSTINTDETSIDDDDNTSWDGKGFLDHDACDYLSSNARYVPNSSDDDDDYGNGILQLSGKNGLGSSSIRAVNSLTPDDLRWLAYSENDKIGCNIGKLPQSDIWNEIIVKGCVAREDRRKRKESRIYSIQRLLES